MKKLPIAAAALLIGTSAYAVIPSAEPTGVMAPTSAHEVSHSGAFAPVAEEGMTAQPAAVDWWGTDSAAKPAAMALKADDAKAEATDPAIDADGWAAAAAAKAEAEGVTDGLDPTMASKLDTASKDVALVKPAALETGFSGDAEAADTAVETAATELAPRPAAQNYPACRPGPGDDNCIQLYEPGVRARLASWDRPTGGFAGEAGTRVAMGGPYEPVAGDVMTHDEARAGDGAIETAMGETARDEDYGVA